MTNRRVVKVVENLETRSKYVGFQKTGAPASLDGIEAPLNGSVEPCYVTSAQCP